jgi:hypothetical protein
MQRLVVVVVALVVAYGVGWVSDAALNDDPCIGAVGLETDSYEDVYRWFPVRTDCRVTTASGAVTVTNGSPRVFWAMFAATFVALIALLVSIKLVWKLSVVVVAAVAAFVVIFI